MTDKRREEDPGGEGPAHGEPAGEPTAGGASDWVGRGEARPESSVLHVEPELTPEEEAELARQRRRRKYATWGGGFVVLLLVGFTLLWFRCGWRGCPDVDMLRGYMPEEASRVVDREGEEIAKLFVTRRVVVGIDSIPMHVQDAFVAIEDRRFRSHGGVDWQRVGGALLSNVRAGGVEEGSSTITMQLARNVFPDKLPANERTLWRKLGEARVARQIEGRYSKAEILELYLNQIYFGHGAYGIESAAQEYFGKSATALTLPEAATLAALPRAPSRLNPRSDPEAAREGRALVLRRMVQQGLITEEERSEAQEANLRLRQRTAKSQDLAPYFVEVVRRQLEEQLGDALYTEGYTIHTTLDLGAQRATEQALTAQLQAIESGRYGAFRHRTYASVQADTSAADQQGTVYLQGAAVFMDARTGDVLALVGGRDFDDSEFNRATQAQRQPGSAFKPFVYAAALQSGIPPTHRLIDQPLRMVIDRGRVWEPRNYEGGYSGVVTMREALRHSKNVATVRLANEVGLSQVLRLAENMGLGRIAPHPAVVLGTAEVTPLRLTSAYGAFATLGSRPEPRFVTAVVDRHGRTVWARPSHTERVLDPGVAFLTVSLMRDVVDRGTGTGVRGVGFRAPAAGKTGTTQDAADVWFVGMTPRVVGSVWIGFDRRQRIVARATGGDLAAPVWGRAMAAISSGDGEWAPPAGVETRMVTAQGGVVGDNCPAGEGAYREYFLRGMSPYGDCYPDQYLALNDTLGIYGDSIWAEYLERREDEEGWWARVRRRLAGGEAEDSLYGIRPSAPPELDEPVAGEEDDEEDAEPPPPEPLGDPVRPRPQATPPRPQEERPRPTPTPTPPPADTGRSAPADTTGTDAAEGSAAADDPAGQVRAAAG